MQTLILECEKLGRRGAGKGGRTHSLIKAKLAAGNIIAITEYLVVYVK